VCVISYDDINAAPEALLRRLCDHLQIPFDPKMLRWEKGGRKEDGLWAPWWYENTHKATGFSCRERSGDTAPIRPEYLPVLKEVMDFYEELGAARL